MDKKHPSLITFHERLETLLQHVKKLIQEAKKNIISDESLYSSLSQTIYDLEQSSEKISKTTTDEELIFDARLIKNILEQPLYPKSLKKKLSLLSAAKLHKETKNYHELKELIQACAEDPIHTEVLLEDLKDISHSISQHKI